MIETKEEYAQTWALINGQDRQVAKDFHATIEALREVARDAKALVDDVHEAFPEGLEELEGLGSYVIALDTSVQDLPDWLTDG